MKFPLSHYTFSVSEPYAAGHVLTPAEAEALNGLRCGNIREIARKEWTRFVGRRDAMVLLSPEEQAAFQAKVTEIDQGYAFRPSGGQRIRSNSIDAEISAVATEHVEALQRQVGAIFGSVEFDRQAALFAAQPEVQDEARLRLAERLRVNSASIADLLS